jgi:HD-like signal output (HDOD) protein
VLPKATVQGPRASIGVRALLAELGDLPARPSVSMKVLQLVDDPRTDATRLGRLVETDPALAAHALRLANAPSNGMSRRIGSARHAVMVLGFELVRSLAALTAGGLLGNGRKVAPPGFWPHALHTAAGAMVVARHTGASEGEAGSAGLLHDLGTALLYRAAPGPYEELLADTKGDPEQRMEEEARRFELTHEEAGAHVLAAWHFPPEMLEVLRDHHRLPVRTTGRLVKVVRAGEALGDLVTVVDQGEALADPSEALRLIGIDDPDLDALQVEVTEQAKSLSSVLT